MENDNITQTPIQTPIPVSVPEPTPTPVPAPTPEPTTAPVPTPEPTPVTPQVEPLPQQPVQNDQSGAPKQKNNKIILIIIGVILGIAAIAALVFFAFLKPNDANSASEDSLVKKNVKITGSVTLLKEYDGSELNTKLVRGFEDAPYFMNLSETGKKAQVLDMDNEELFIIDEQGMFDSAEYTGDGYFTFKSMSDDKFYVYDTKGNMKEFDTAYELNHFYKDGVLYYSFEKTDENDKKTVKTQAYSLKENKVLWEIDGVNPFILENGKLVLQENKYQYNKNNKIVNSETGETLRELKVEGETDESGTYVTEGGYLIVDDNKLEAYDYDGNKLSSYQFENGEMYRHSLRAVLGTGGYVIRIYNKKNIFQPYQYKVFDKNGKEVLSFESDKGVTYSLLYTQPYGGGYAEKNTTSKYAFLNVETYDKLTYVIYEDGTIDTIYDMVKIGDYAIGRIENDYDHVKMINLNTKKSKIFDEPLRTTAVSPSTNDYFIFSARTDADNDYYVYDKDFNKIYSSDNYLRVVNDEYFLETESEGYEKTNIYLVNAKTQEKKLLETTGVYDFNTENNLVTREFNGSKQWLYKFQ